MSLRETYLAGAGKVLNLQPAQSLVATTLSTQVATAGYQDMAAAILNVGTPTGTGETLDVTIETSPNGTTGWVTLASFAHVGTTGGAQVVPVDMSASLGFVRGKFTIGGTSPAYPVALTVLALPRN